MLIPYAKDLWNIMRAYPSVARCLWHLHQLHTPIITIFGGRNVDINAPYFVQAQQLSAQLIRNNYSIITGGGPGIMEAGLLGAASAGGKAYWNFIGIGVRGVDATFVSKSGCKTYSVADFGTRTWLLIKYSDMYIIFPGGIGTLNELTEVLNLIKAKKIPKKPIILVGTDYWYSLLTWFQQAVHQGYILNDYKDLITVIDNNQEIINHIMHIKNT